MEDDMIDRDNVSLPDAPVVTGLVFRRFRGPADYAPMVAVREGAQEWDRVDPLSAREAIPTADEGYPEPRTLATNVASTEREADALIRGDGYVDVRRLIDMVLGPLRALPPVPLPPHVVLRPIKPGHYRAI